MKSHPRGLRHGQGDNSSWLTHFSPTADVRMIGDGVVSIVNVMVSRRRRLYRSYRGLGGSTSASILVTAGATACARVMSSKYGRNITSAGCSHCVLRNGITMLHTQLRSEGSEMRVKCDLCVSGVHEELRHAKCAEL